MDKTRVIPRQCSCGCRDIREDYGVWYCFSCGHRFYLEKEKDNGEDRIKRM